MGKVKPKLRGLSERTKKKEIHKTKLNPFEIHVNRQKYDVIGRKSKSERGLPGISRSRAMKKRQATLLQEYKIKDKSNKFFDRRIGEKNKEMTHEDRVIARFTAERIKTFNKKQIYNLADDEVLTHRGQTVSEIEKFDDPRSEDDDDDDETMGDTGKLGADFVGGAHFGGGLRKSEEGEKKSRKDLIEQLIAESKKRKAEKQCIREHTIELTEKLDTEWHDLLPIMTSSKKKPTDVAEVEKPDSYDIMMRELKFETRVQASEPLKTEEEIKLEESQKRAELQAEREKRMLSDSGANEQTFKYRSADDLDDGFVIDNDPDVTISYDFEGNIQIDGQVEKGEIGKGGKNSVNQRQNLMEDGKVEGDDEIESNDDNENSSSEEEDEDEDEDEETDDSLSDLKPASEIELGEDEANASLGNQKDDLEENKGNKSNTTNDMVKPVRKTFVVDKTLSQEEKNIFLQDVRKKFPNFSDVPDNYKSLQKILEIYDAERQGIIVSHIIDKNQIGLNESSRTRLLTLFGFLLQHLLHLASKCAVESMMVLNYLAPRLFDLVHLSPENASECVLEIIKEKQQEFQKKQHKYPTFETLFFFKVVSLIYPTSDFRHPVVTPAIVFICQMLFQCHIKSRKDISAGLFLVTMFLEFTVLSKRFSPAAINFLCGILHLAIPKRLVSVQNALPNPPFRRFGSYSELLVLENKVVEADYPLQMKLSDLAEETIDASFKIRSLATAVSMLNEFLLNLSNLQASPSIFHRASILLSKVPSENYPCTVQLEIGKLSEAFQKLKERTVQYLVVERKRPKALRLYEPSIEKVFDGKRRRPMGPKKMEREILLHKIKQEKKSAVREIRRDNSFLAKLKWKETIKSDKERIQKVKEIFGSASTQLGEIRALERKKKHRT